MVCVNMYVNVTQDVTEFLCVHMNSTHMYIRSDFTAQDIKRRS